MRRKLAAVMSAVLLLQPCVQVYGQQTTPTSMESLTISNLLKATNSNTSTVTDEKESDKATDSNALIPFAQAENGESIQLLRGQTIKLDAPSHFQGEVTWTSTNGFNNVGATKIKRPLLEGESDGTRTYGIASASHLASVDENGVVKGIEKGNGIIITAIDESENIEKWTVDVRYYSDEELIKGSQEDFINLRKKYVETLVGADNDMSDPEVAEFVAIIDANAKTWWDTYEYKGSDVCSSVPWEADLTFKGDIFDLAHYMTNAPQFRVSYQHVEAMAKAYATSGSAYYNNKDLLKDIIEIMDWLSENCYYPRSQTNNWWDWEIGVPKQLFPICLYIYDDVEKEKLETYVKAYEIMQPDPFNEGSIGTASTHTQGYREATSANKMDCAYSTIGLGLVLGDAEYLALASEAAASNLSDFQKPVLQEDGTYLYTNGFYEDGSYIDHSKVPYTVSYGYELLNGSINIINIFGKTPWILNDDNLEMLQNYVVKGYIPAIYKGAALEMLRGRAISRPTLSDRNAGRNIMIGLVKLIDIVDDQTAMTIKQNVKYWITEDDLTEQLAGITELNVLSKVKEILADDTINMEAANETMHRVYPLMDRTIHRMDNYLFGISMYSSRIQNCEVMNSENLKGWFTGSGMTYLYNDDFAQYTDNYWNTVNPFMLPGTTVVPVEIDKGKPDGQKFYQSGDFLSPEHWVGGTSIGNYGVSGMALNGTAMSNGDKSNTSDSNYADNLRGKKSYFMFEDEIVCIGAGINNKNSGDLVTMTTVENRKLKDDNSNVVTIDGTELVDLDQKEVTPKWMHLEGNTEQGSDIGYYFPENQKIQVGKLQESGSWKDVNDSLNAKLYPSVTKNYFGAWFEHGTEPVDETYSYMLLPDKTVDETEEYAKNPSSQIVANTKEVQAVRNKRLDILAANFWTDETVTVDELTVTGQASVMMKKEGNQLKLSVADPTMINTGNVIVKITGQKGTKVTSSDENVKVKLTDNTIELTINVKGKCGYSSYAQIELYEDKPVEEPKEDNKDSSSRSTKVSNVTGSWEKTENGWCFKDKDGSYITNSWIMVDSKWYYLDANGYMLSGWIQNGDAWYHLSADGAMTTGWVQDSANKWYYMGINGQMKTGWNTIKNSSYYLENSGAMHTGWIQGADGKWYYMDDNGSMKVNGWIGNYYVDRNGEWKDK